MTTNSDNNCYECNKLHSITCDICDEVIGTEKRECEEHNETVMLCGRPGVTCQTCQKKRTIDDCWIWW